MPPQVIKNKETGELALFDTDTQQMLGQVLRNAKTGEFGLWDGNKLSPIQMPKEATERQDVINQLASEPASMTKQAVPGLGSRIYNEIFKQKEPDYFGQIGEAVTRMVEPKEEGTFPGRQISDFLASKGYGGTGAAIATATELPGMAVRGAAGAVDIITNILGIPYGARRAEQGARAALPESTGTDIAATAVNVGVNLLAPGGMARGAQKAAQKILPKLPGASDALRTMETEKFASTLGNQQIAANKQLVQRQQAFDALGNERLPMPNAVAAIDDAIASASQPFAMGAGTKAALEEAKMGLAAMGNGLSPRELQAWMTNVGRKTKALFRQGEDNVGDIFKPLFAAIARDAETPFVRTQTLTPRAKAPVLGLPAPGEAYPVAGGRFEAGVMQRTIQVPPKKGLLELPAPTGMEVPTGTVGVGAYRTAAKGETIEVGRIPMTRQVQSPPTERGGFTVIEEGGRARLEPKQYIAPTSGEVPYSGVEIMREGARPISPGGSALGRRQVALTPEGQTPFRNPTTGELIAKELKDPWKPGKPVTAFSVTETSARPIRESVTGRIQRVLSPAEQRAFRDPETGAIVAPGTRVQYADTSGQTVLDYRAAIAQEKGLKDVSKMFDKLIAVKTQGVPIEGFENMNGVKALAWFQDARNFKKLQGIPESDIADLEAIAVRIAELPPLSPKGHFGSGRMVAVSGMLGGLGTLMGISPSVAYGTASTIAALPTISRMLLPSAIGRKALRAVLESGPIDQIKMDMLVGLARGVAESSQIADEIKKSLGYSEVPLTFKQQLGVMMGQR